VELRIATWNLQGRDPDAAGLSALVEELEPDILLLQEHDDTAFGASAHAERYPHRLVRPDAGYRPGMAIHSRWPLAATGELGEIARPAAGPRLIWARVVAGGSGTALVVASIHAPAPIGNPRNDNPWRRSVSLRAIRGFALDLAEAGGRAIIGGDTNTIRYAVPGYRDAALHAGRPDRTWRPIGGIPWLPPVARLDRILVGPGLGVTSAHTRCGLSRSDHCPVVAVLEV
jgi:exonuclease III